VVPLDRISRLERLDSAAYEWIFANTWDEAGEVIRTRPVDLGVVDPLVRGETGVAEVERLREQFPSLPLLLYCALSPTVATILLRLGRVGVRRVIFAHFEDGPANLRQIVSRELEQTALQQVMSAVDNYFQRLPGSLRIALEMSLYTPDHRASVDLLAGQARLSRRECQEWFTRAQLPVPRIVLVLMRLLYAHRLLRDPGHTLENVARKLGYAKARTLQLQLRTVFGVTAGELRDVTPLAAAEAIVQRYFVAALSEAAQLAEISERLA